MTSGLCISKHIEIFTIESSIVTEVDVEALQSSMTIIFVGCVSYTETDISPSSRRVVEPLDTSRQRRIIILARAIEISSRFGRQCPGNVRAIYFPLKITIPQHIQRDPEAGPSVVREHDSSANR